MRSRALWTLCLLLPALTRGAEVYVSTDGGETWSSRGPKNYDVTHLLPDPKNPDVAWAIAMPTIAKHGEDLRFASPAVLRTGDSGKTWETIESYRGPDPFCIAVDPLNTDVVYVGATFGRIQKSTDGCRTWSLINLRESSRKLDGTPAELLTNVHSVCVRGDRLLSAGRGYLALSTDAGKSWTLIKADFPVSCVLAGDRILAANNTGDALSSADDGRTWTKFREGRG